jgi:hypothetical protein
MKHNQFEMTVCVNGRPIREFGHRGLTFVEGRKNQPYTIRFRNNTSKRVLAVVSVDGLCVVDGKPADNDSRGYIVPAYQQTEITGWRTSLEETHDFVFDAKPRAYSTQTQKDDINCGVVEVKVFYEVFKVAALGNILRSVSHEHHHHHHHWPQSTWVPMTPCDPHYACCTSLGSPGISDPPNITSSVGNSLGLDMSEVHVNFAASAQNMSAAAPAQKTPDFNLGTGWGKVNEDKVDEAKFERGFEAADFSIYYSDAAGLKMTGIEVDKKPAVSKPVLPRGFNGFCKPPNVCSGI